MNCNYCSSARTIKRGHFGRHGQRYMCKACRKTFSTGGKRVSFTFTEKSHIAKKSYGYGNLVRTCRTFRLSKNTVYKWRELIRKHEEKLQYKIGYY